jgi:hypothetical protein
MREGELRHRKHLDDIRLEDIGDSVEVYLRQVGTAELLRGIVDQDIDVSIFLYVRIDGLLAETPVAEVPAQQEALASFGLDESLRLLRVFFFNREVDDCYVGAFFGVQGCD